MSAVVPCCPGDVKTGCMYRRINGDKADRRSCWQIQECTGRLVGNLVDDKTLVWQKLVAIELVVRPGVGEQRRWETNAQWRNTYQWLCREGKGIHMWDWWKHQKRFLAQSDAELRDI